MITNTKFRIFFSILLFLVLVGCLLVVMNTIGRKIEETPNAPNIFVSNTSELQHPTLNDTINDTKNNQEQINAYIPLSFYEVEANYKLKRNRATPVRFKKWYDFAVENQCNLDEDTYNNIYEDISPFFGMSSKEFNHRLSLLSGKSYMEPITVKDGKTNSNREFIINVCYFTCFLNHRLHIFCQI